MDIFINERSFNNQAQPHTVDCLLEQIHKTIALLQIINPGAEIVVHSSLRSCLLCQKKPLVTWLSAIDEAENTDNDAGDFLTQPIVLLILSAFTRGPFVEMLLEEHEHACAIGDINYDYSAIAAAACLGGIVVSLDKHDDYPDGALTVQLMHGSSELREVMVPHFVTVEEARKCRRRYIPNPKHHPNIAKGKASVMEPDREYDSYSKDEIEHFRHANDCDMPETRCQHLLDISIPSGKQLYTAIFSRGKIQIFYEFQDDNQNGFHGYPVPEAQVPADVVKELKRRVLEE